MTLQPGYAAEIAVRRPLRRSSALTQRAAGCVLRVAIHLGSRRSDAYRNKLHLDGCLAENGGVLSPLAQFHLRPRYRSTTLSPTERPQRRQRRPRRLSAAYMHGADAHARGAPPSSVDIVTTRIQPASVHASGCSPAASKQRFSAYYMPWPGSAPERGGLRDRGRHSA